MKKVYLCLQQQCNGSSRFITDLKLLAKKTGEHNGHDFQSLDDIQDSLNGFDGIDLETTQPNVEEEVCRKIERQFNMLMNKFSTDIKIFITNLKEVKINKLIQAVISNDQVHLEANQEHYYMLLEPQKLIEDTKQKTDKAFDYVTEMVQQINDQMAKLINFQEPSKLDHINYFVADKQQKQSQPQAQQIEAPLLEKAEQQQQQYENELKQMMKSQSQVQLQQIDTLNQEKAAQVSDKKINLLEQNKKYFEIDDLKQDVSQLYKSKIVQDFNFEKLQKELEAQYIDSLTAQQQYDKKIRKLLEQNIEKEDQSNSKDKDVDIQQNVPEMDKSKQENHFSVEQYKNKSFTQAYEDHMLEQEKAAQQYQSDKKINNLVKQNKEQDEQLNLMDKQKLMHNQKYYVSQVYEGKKLQDVNVVQQYKKSQSSVQQTLKQDITTCSQYDIKMIKFIEWNNQQDVYSKLNDKGIDNLRIYVSKLDFNKQESDYNKEKQKRRSQSQLQQIYNQKQDMAAQAQQSKKKMKKLIESYNKKDLVELKQQFLFLKQQANSFFPQPLDKK